MKIINSIKYILSIFIIALAFNSKGQVESQKPQPSALTPVMPTQQPQYTLPKTVNANQQPTSQQKINEVKAILQEDEQRSNPTNKTRTIQYTLPSKNYLQGADFYNQAYTDLVKMLDGKTELSLKKAVFITENAFFEDIAKYEGYDKQIKEFIQFCQIKAHQENIDWNNEMARLMMIKSFMSDTLEIKDYSTEKPLVHYPMQYDFEDIWGAENWTKMFVTKLMATGSGQCHSMPLLYLILAEETNTEAYLAFSPSHSYVKFKDKKDTWYNLELTNGRFVSDAWIIGSGYIKAEAVKSKAYMTAISKKETIATLLVDLAKGYIGKYGYDEFVYQCLQASLKYYPDNLYALQTLSDYNTMTAKYVTNQINDVKSIEELYAKYPKAKEVLEKMYALYDKIDRSGFQQMPDKAYQEWLNSVNEEKNKREDQQKTIQLNKTF